nr:hypothetical protein [Tanacetum cinerariifolium]
MDAGELPKMDPYKEVAQQGQAPPLLPAYIPSPIELDEHEDHIDYPADEGDGDDEPFDDDNDDDDTDDEDERPTEDEDNDEEEEHLAPADSSAVPVIDLVPSAGDIEAFETDEFPVMSSDITLSAVTYTSISFELDRPSWGISLMDAGELPKMDPYKEVAQQGQAPPLLPAYIPSPIELDEHVPYANNASPIAKSPGHIADSESMEEDSIDYPDEPEDDDEDPGEDP